MSIQLPEAFCQRMQTIMGDSYDAFLASYDREPQKGLRINTCKITREEFLAHTDLPLRPVPFFENGYYLDVTESGTGNLPSHHAGQIYLQEPAAMLPVAAASIENGSFVLDVCAAPGGKSTQIASLIGEKGLLCANEFVSSRTKILQSNIERLGIRNAIVTNTDAAHLRKWYAGCFDCVVVDAPCSGEGMFRKNPQAVMEWSEEAVKMCAERSFKILDDAEYCLRSGGILVYSTCTFSLEENELLIGRFLDTHPEYTVQKLPEAICRMSSPGYPVAGHEEETVLSARCYPHITGGEGQFVCVLQKGGDQKRKEPEDRTEALTQAEQKTAKLFLTDLFRNPDSFNLRKAGNLVYVMPKQMKVPGVCFSCGVRLGEWRDKRIVPHHQLFSAYGTKMKRMWNFRSSDPRIMRYLHGETLTLTENDLYGSDYSDGFGAVLVDGCALGGAKKVGAVLKNHYPKGLRTPNI